jgi:MAP3K TRAFs-binding domain
MKELCFVLMPFGKKPDATGVTIDFDAVYRDLIAPAVEGAGMQPLRADEEMTGGIIHKPMFERLVLCNFAVADLTTANANVFYELGVRHAARPWSTVLVFAEGGRLPFDVAPLRAIPYRISGDGVPVDVEPLRAAVTARLLDARKSSADHPAIDSPLFQLLDGYPNPPAHEKTDIFREQVEYSAEMKERLGVARAQGLEAVRAVDEELGDLRAVESGVVIDLFLSYRAVSAWTDMVALVKRMPRVLAATVMVQEQLAFALNRSGEGERAERVLLDLVESRGPSSETFGILGRVYKDRWDAAVAGKDALLAPVLLDRAIEAYLKGFQTDWRDAYPGVNALTLMTLREPPDPRRLELLPVVRYAVEQKVARGTPDYWDHATLLELAALSDDAARGASSLANAVSLLKEPWQAQTTARNLKLLREARERRGESTDWIAQAEQELLARSAPASVAAA